MIFIATLKFIVVVSQQKKLKSYKSDIIKKLHNKCLKIKKNLDKKMKIKIFNFGI